MAFWVRQREIVPPKLSICLGTFNHPKRNWKQSSWKFLGDNKEYYGIFEKALLRTYILWYFSKYLNGLLWLSLAFRLNAFLLLLFFFFAVFVFFYIYLSLYRFTFFFWHIEMLRRKLILKRSVFTLKSTSPATPPCNQFFCPWYMRVSLCLQIKIAFCS